MSSYHDQETYYNLYKISDGLEVSFIHTFFKDWNNTSSGFSFRENEFAVSFPSVLEYYSLEKDELSKLWEIDIIKYKSEYNLSCLVTLDDNTIVLGKGKTIVIINISKETIVSEVNLNLLAEIRDLYVNKEHLIISTDKELKIICLNKIKHRQIGSVYEVLRRMWDKLIRIN
ncbi:hypothetical protein [Myroides profundi]|uniref:Uncharacterized protein n=1 Tax=Myroides profundi TaxID=480520 RepID=A0AAJ4W324_MYRPR|nr:hypothetical protein [Myroides profundi]AJH13661.1 hypothetical protein MPR_0450 [Myroides profundi]SEP89927.1 hypothetical protein SAMN04488089_10140 [Myroides profundi]